MDVVSQGQGSSAGGLLFNRGCRMLPELFRPTLLGQRAVAHAVRVQSPWLIRGFSTKIVPHPLPRLATIDALVKAASADPRLTDPLPRTAFIGVQHVLETTGTLFRSLIELGVKPENMFFTGKCYSTSPTVAEAIKQLGVTLNPGTSPATPGDYLVAHTSDLTKMWEMFTEHLQKTPDIERVVILDDGAGAMEYLPTSMRPSDLPIVGIEQTRAGLYSQELAYSSFPIIDVATSVAKKETESPRVVDVLLSSISSRISTMGLNKANKYGVIGLGSIGEALVRRLILQGYKVSVFDKDSQKLDRIVGENITQAASIADLIANTDCVIGCTGQDVTEGLCVRALAKRDKIFISASSEDREFWSLLKELTWQSRMIVDPLSDITGLSEKLSRIKVINGGFPINFDRSPTSVASHDIEVTRGALLSACLQAAVLAADTKQEKVRYCLDPYLQRFVANCWGSRLENAARYPEGFFERFNDIDWVIRQSGGTYYPNKLLEFDYQSAPTQEPTSKSGVRFSC